MPWPWLKGTSPLGLQPLDDQLLVRIGIGLLRVELLRKGGKGEKHLVAEQKPKPQHLLEPAANFLEPVDSTLQHRRFNQITLNVLRIMAEETRKVVAFDDR